MSDKLDDLIEELRVLVVHPDEKLLIHLPADTEFDDAMIEDFNEALRGAGLGHRTLVLIGEMEFVVLKDD